MRTSPRSSTGSGCRWPRSRGAPSSSTGGSPGPGNGADAQSDSNRRFIIADFLDRWITPPRPTTDYPPELILAVARTFATLTRGRLGDAFPERRFEIEVIGAEGVDDEPLEVAVTFFEP